MRRAVRRRHSLKWGALTGMLGSGTALLQFIPQSWPTWVGIGLTLAAFAVTGISAVIGGDDA